MKKIIFTLNILLPVGMLLSVQNLSAEIKTAPAAAKTTSSSDVAKNNTGDLVVKVISGREVLATSEEGKKLELELTQKRSQIESQGQRMEQELKNDVSKLQTKAKIMSPADIEREQDNLMRKEKEFKAKMESLQEEFSRNVQRDLAKFNSKISEMVVKAAKSNGWDIVILKESGEIIYASDRVDATNAIVALLNKELDSKPADKK